MAIETWLSFCALVWLMVMTPGPSVLIGMSHSLRYGPVPTLMTALGDVTANMIQMVVAAVGVGAILATSPTAFMVVKWGGVAFLFILGLMAVLRKSPENKDNNGIEINKPTSYEPVRRRRLFGEGFLVAAGNPKAIAFFGALFPQFINPSAPLTPQLLILGATFVVFDYTFVMIYAFGASRILPWLQRKGGKNVIGRVSGSVLIIAALLLSFIKMPDSIAHARQITAQQEK